jgi:hypothetical protein|uniref:Uncharacterized protein n=1 Tax=Fagus sylvatica TaxID=28930 RepID=A0A2N9IQA8_FAGSY
MDDKDLDDATLWAVIDSAVASHSASKSRKPLAIKSPNFQSLSPISNPSPPTKFHKYPRTPNSTVTDSRVSAQGEVLHEPWVYHPPRKVARTCPSESSETSPLVVLRNVRRMPTAPVYSSPKAYLSSHPTVLSACLRHRGSRCCPLWFLLCRRGSRLCPSWVFAVLGLHCRGSPLR